jgi:hypothetical protein
MNTACCMRPGCRDLFCPGRALALSIIQHDGGHEVHREVSVRIEPLAPEERDDRGWRWGFAALKAVLFLLILAAIWLPLYFKG